jgi:hypothetical protein
MLDKLFAKTLLRISCPLQRFQRDLEGSLTIRADPNGWYGAQPFRHSEIRLCHAVGGGLLCKLMGHAAYVVQGPCCDTLFSGPEGFQ